MDNGEIKKSSKRQIVVVEAYTQLGVSTVLTATAKEEKEEFGQTYQIYNNFNTSYISRYYIKSSF